MNETRQLLQIQYIPLKLQIGVETVTRIIFESVKVRIFEEISKTVASHCLFSLCQSVFVIRIGIEQSTRLKFSLPLNESDN